MSSTKLEFPHVNVAQLRDDIIKAVKDNLVGEGKTFEPAVMALLAEDFEGFPLHLAKEIETICKAMNIMMTTDVGEGTKPS